MPLSPFQLPSYVIINDPFSEKKDILKKPAEAIDFPLTEKVLKIIHQLEAKFEQEENCGGLAAPQIGYSYRIVVLSAEKDEEIKKFRPDFSDTLPKSIWLNPTFTPLSSEETVDWEACFSVADLVARVPRFTNIAYEAWTPAGQKVQGAATGFLARLIQHEIDHLNGILFIDHVPENEVITREEFKKIRESS